MTNIQIPVPPVTPPTVTVTATVPPVTPPALTIDDNQLLGMMPVNDVITYLTSKGYVVTSTPPPPPPPPPPPQSATTSITDFSGFHMGMFTPAWATPAAAVPNKIALINTSHGPGFDIHCADTDLTLWDHNMKTIALRGDYNPTGVTRTFDFWVNIPAQTLVGPTHWNTGVIFESGHDTIGSNSGHKLDIDNTGRGPGGKPCFRISRKSLRTGDVFVFNPPLILDNWYHIQYTVRWSEGADGVVKVVIDGTTWLDFKGQTWWAADGKTFWNFSWYSELGAGTSEVQYAGIQIIDA
jgi:hypothetical protein